MRNLWLAAAALGLAACGGGASEESGANEAQANNATPPNAAAEAPPATSNSANSVTVTREQIVGVWTTDGDCSVNPYRVEDDNSIYRHGGNEVGTWALKDNKIELDLDDPPGKGIAEMNATGAIVVSLNGQNLTFTRC